MKVIKRNGQLEDFKLEKIVLAVTKCYNASGVGTLTPEEVAQAVIEQLSGDVISIEDIQNLIEQVLIYTGNIPQARAYISYRDKRAEKRRLVPPQEKEKFDQSKQYFHTQIQEFMFYNTYSRFDYDQQRRETWEEAVERVVNYLYELSDGKLSPEDYELIRQYILEMKVMPSMRLLAMAGPAARRQNASIYNCSFIPVDSLESFCEALLISMSGCGVGFSVESRYVNQINEVKRFGQHLGTYTIKDSTEGWVEALRFALNTWINGNDVEFDFSLIRPAGSVLLTKGGRASGPDPLRDMLMFVKQKIRSKAGAKLTPLDCHDIMCSVGNAAVMGGTRRTAMISLFDKNDYEMRHCKDGAFYVNNPQRANANNSIVFNEPVSAQEIGELMLDVARGGTGEPGIFSRFAAKNTMPTRRNKEYDFGTNPCGEIVLRPRQFCNLSVAVARSDDTEETLLQKIKVATIIGTIQSMATNFPGLSDEWKANCEEERLLGVDVIGQMDCPVFRNLNVMKKARAYSTSINKKYAKILGIGASASITCVKPSGNSAQLLNSSSGVHTRWSKYYIRNIRISSSSSLFRILKDQLVPMSPENGFTEDNAPTWVIHFPIKTPDDSITRGDLGLSDQLQYWLDVKQNWTDHNPSVTIYFHENEILDLAKWVFDQQDVIGGMSFLPQQNIHYAQMPYEEISKLEYESLIEKFPIIDFSMLFFEKSDFTTSSSEIACSSGACEI
jgi:ribonucleoside-triphosphate reductase